MKKLIILLIFLITSAIFLLLTGCGGTAVILTSEKGLMKNNNKEYLYIAGKWTGKHKGYKVKINVSNLDNGYFKVNVVADKTTQHYFANLATLIKKVDGKIFLFCFPDGEKIGKKLSTADLSPLLIVPSMIIYEVSILNENKVSLQAVSFFKETSHGKLIRITNDIKQIDNKDCIYAAADELLTYLSRNKYILQEKTVLVRNK